MFFVLFWRSTPAPVVPARYCFRVLERNLGKALGVRRPNSMACMTLGAPLYCLYRSWASALRQFCGMPQPRVK